MPLIGSSGASLTTPTSISGATSPAPRAIARMTPVRMPGAAAGSTTRAMVCHREAPQARAPSRAPRGTAESASSAATITTGTVSSARVSDAHSTPPVPKVGLFGRRSAKKVLSTRPPIL